MGRPSTVRFGGRRAAGATAGKRGHEPPSSVLSFKAINQVLQNVLQVRTCRCHLALLVSGQLFLASISYPGASDSPVGSLSCSAASRTLAASMPYACASLCCWCTDVVAGLAY